MPFLFPQTLTFLQGLHAIDPSCLHLGFRIVRVDRNTNPGMPWPAEKPISYLGLSPTSSSPTSPLELQKIGFWGWGQFYKDEDHSLQLPTLRSASGLSLLGCAVYCPPWCLLPTLVSSVVQPHSAVASSYKSFCFPPLSSFRKELALLLFYLESRQFCLLCMCVKCTDLFHYRIIFMCSFMKISLTGCLFTHRSRTAQLLALWLGWSSFGTWVFLPVKYAHDPQVYSEDQRQVTQMLTSYLAQCLGLLYSTHLLSSLLDSLVLMQLLLSHILSTTFRLKINQSLL